MNHSTRMLVALVVIYAASGHHDSQPWSTVSSAMSLEVVARSTEPKPKFILRRHDEVQFESGSSLQSWDIDASQLLQMKIQLLHFQDGSSSVIQQETLSWTEWPKAPDVAKWHVHLLIEKGNGMIDAGRRLPSIALQFEDCAPDSITAQNTLRTVADLSSKYRHVAATNLGSEVPPSQTYTIWSEIQVNLEDGSAADAIFDETIETLENAATGGRSALGVFIEWTPVKASTK